MRQLAPLGLLGLVAFGTVVVDAQTPEERPAEAGAAVGSFRQRTTLRLDGKAT